MSFIQKQLSLLFDKRKQTLFVDDLTYQRIRSQVFNYPKNIKMDILIILTCIMIYIENHEPIIHNKISNYELILDALDIKLGGY